MFRGLVVQDADMGFSFRVDGNGMDWMRASAGAGLHSRKDVGAGLIVEEMMINCTRRMDDIKSFCEVWCVRSWWRFLQLSLQR